MIKRLHGKMANPGSIPHFRVKSHRFLWRFIKKFVDEIGTVRNRHPMEIIDGSSKILKRSFVKKGTL